MKKRPLGGENYCDPGPYPTTTKHDEEIESLEIALGYREEKKKREECLIM